MTIKEKVINRIKRSKHQLVFVIGDFTDISSPETVRKIFFQACEMGILFRIAKGLYAKPVMSEFGMVPPSLEVIAEEIARRDYARIIPSGSTASNLVGLSTQIPMKLSYLTSGSTRSIDIGNRTISFRHASPRNFAAKGRLIPLLTQALKDIGEDAVGENVLRIIQRFINEHPDPFFEHDLLLAPQWVQKIIKQSQNNNL